MFLVDMALPVKAKRQKSHPKKSISLWTLKKRLGNMLHSRSPPQLLSKVMAQKHF
jgi:hypothetical protein